MAQEKEPVQLTLAESIDHAKQFPPNSPQTQELNQAVCNFLVKGMHPLSTVEEAGFHNLMYNLIPDIVVLLESTFQNRSSHNYMPMFRI